MGIMEWFKNLFHKENAVSEEPETAAPEPVLSIDPAPAPEPVPERKTSDEIIEEMAQSQADKAAAEAEETAAGPEEDTIRRQSEEEPDDTFDVDDILYTENGEAAIEEDTHPEEVGF